MSLAILAQGTCVSIYYCLFVRVFVCECIDFLLIELIVDKRDSNIDRRQQLHGKKKNSEKEKLTIQSRFNPSSVIDNEYPS